MAVGTGGTCLIHYESGSASGFPTWLLQEELHNGVPLEELGVMVPEKLPRGIYLVPVSHYADDEGNIFLLVEGWINVFPVWGVLL